MILLIDNYDSFVHNLARYFRRLGQETCVVRNDAITVEDVRRSTPLAIVLSPGPCTPGDAGASIAIVREFYRSVPMLGVCLGHQAIATAFGTDIVRACEPMHGRTSTMNHCGAGLFTGLPSPMNVCRYHSLVVEEATLPAELLVTARTSDGTIMAIELAEFPVFGVQFHPEAILTQYGFGVLANFLRQAGIGVDNDLDEIAKSEFHHFQAVETQLPAQPVTF